MRIRGCAAIFSLLGVLPLAGCTAAPPPFGASFDGETLTVITALCPTEKPVSLALRKPGTDLSDPPDFLQEGYIGTLKKDPDVAAVNVFKGTDWSVTRGSLTGAGSFTIYFKTKLDSYAMYWKPEQVQELNVAPGEFLVVFEGRGQGHRF